MAGASGVLLYGLWLLLGLFQIAAFLQGMEMWLGTHFVVSFVLGLLLIAVIPLGGIVSSGIAFYGAWKGWRWEVWQAALLAFPFVILQFTLMGAGSAAFALKGLRTRTPAAPPVAIESMPVSVEVEAKKVAEQLQKEAEDCIAAIAAKWRTYQATVRWKDGVSLADQIDTFAMPVEEYVRNHYPKFLDRPGFFHAILFVAIRESRTHPGAEVTAAIAILRDKYTR